MLFNGKGKFQGGKFYTGTTKTAGPLMPSIIKHHHGDILEVIASKIPHSVLDKVQDYYASTSEEILSKYLESKVEGKEFKERNLNN